MAEKYKVNIFLEDILVGVKHYVSDSKEEAEEHFRENQLPEYEKRYNGKLNWHIERME